MTVNATIFINTPEGYFCLRGPSPSALISDYEFFAAGSGDVRSENYSLDTEKNWRIEQYNDTEVNPLLAFLPDQRYIFMKNPRFCAVLHHEANCGEVIEWGLSFFKKHIL